MKRIRKQRTNVRIFFVKTNLAFFATTPLYKERPKCSAESCVVPKSFFYRTFFHVANYTLRFTRVNFARAHRQLYKYLPHP